MSNPVKRVSVEEAIEDLQNHTLEGISGSIAKLIYLASTRDYNSGRYYHDGLAFRFTEEVAQTALGLYHAKVFQELVSSSLEELCSQLESYMKSSGIAPNDFLELWRKLEPYRVTVPLDCDNLSASLFFSNIKVALAILQTRPETIPHN
jgi:hypothetical protein